METVFFWIAWGIISFWALKTFYYSFSKEKVTRLRKAAFGINLAVLILTFLPWLPASLASLRSGPAGGPLSLGGKTGLDLALGGNILSVIFVILLAASIVLFLSKNTIFLKLAALATITNTFVLFVLMYQLRPGTFILTLYDIAPIIAFMFFLVCDVVVLLLWQQLQLKERKGKRR